MSHYAKLGAVIMRSFGLLMMHRKSHPRGRLHACRGGTRDWRFAILAAALACGRPQRETRVDTERSTVQSHTAKPKTPVCVRPARGIIVGHDSVAGFSTHATLGALRQQCDRGEQNLYDAVGWQAAAWTFPFEGAQVMAVQSKHEGGGSPVDDEIPDLWIVSGDSARLPDGELVPRTLGELRARYGFAIVDENINADDIDEPHARSCRFPYLRFALSVNDTARKVPDSARVTSVDVDTSGVEEISRSLCITHQSTSER